MYVNQVPFPLALTAHFYTEDETFIIVNKVFKKYVQEMCDDTAEAYPNFELTISFLINLSLFI